MTPFFFCMCCYAPKVRDGRVLGRGRHASPSLVSFFPLLIKTFQYAFICGDFGVFACLP